MSKGRRTTIYINHHACHRERHSPSSQKKKMTEVKKITIVFDFGFLHVRRLRIKWDILTRLSRMRKGESVDPPMLVASF